MSGHNLLYSEPQPCSSASQLASYTHYLPTYPAQTDDSYYSDETATGQLPESMPAAYAQYASGTLPVYPEPEYSAPVQSMLPPLEYGYAYADSVSETQSTGFTAPPVPASSFSTLDHPSHRVVNQVESGQDRVQQVDQSQHVGYEVFARFPCFDHTIDNSSDALC